MQDRFRHALRANFAEFDVAEVPSPTPREARLVELPGKADVVIGMRRVGKSWLLQQRIHELLAAGVPRGRILYLEFEDERLSGLGLEHLQLVDDEFHARHPESRGQECWYFFDEVQEVPGWEKYVRRLLRDRNLHIALTGSSARLLSTEIATSMRGRALTTELLPFSLAEAARHRGIALPERWPVAGAHRSRLQRCFDEYLAIGGFPEVQLLDPDVWRRILQSCFEITLLRDIAERHGITNFPALRFLARRLLRSVGSRASANALYNDVRSQGIAASKDLVHFLLGCFEETFLAFLLPLHTKSERQRNSNPRKVYAIDHGLVRACVPAHSAEVGHLLENLVYLELRRRGTVLGYYLTADGFEVDFVFEDRQGARALVQSCADMGNPSTRERQRSCRSDRPRRAPPTNIRSASSFGIPRAGRSRPRRTSCSWCRPTRAAAPRRRTRSTC
jgi:predicted AAA+ superfamily ATPase